MKRYQRETMKFLQYLKLLFYNILLIIDWYVYMLV